MRGGDAVLVLGSDGRIDVLYHTMLRLGAHGWVREQPAGSHLLRFVLPGFSLRPLEMEGALGQGQLRKLPGFVALLRASGVECRPIVAGNYLANPVVTYLDHSVAGPVPVAEDIDANGFFNGNHHYSVQDKLHQISQLVGDCAVGSRPN